MKKQENTDKLFLIMVAASAIILLLNFHSVIAEEFAPSEVYNHTSKENTNAMKADFITDSILRTIDEKLDEDSYISDPESSKAKLKSDTMDIIENILNDQDYAAYVNAQALKKDASELLTSDGMEILSPHIESVIQKFQMDTAPITPADSNNSQTTFGPTPSFFIVIALLIIAIAMGAAVSLVRRRRGTKRRSGSSAGQGPTISPEQR